MTSRPPNMRLPYFEPEMTKSGRWFVAVKTGNGPNSHIGDFDTEAEAKNWILAKSKYWPNKPHGAKVIRAEGEGQVKP